jgi:transcriptional regulator with XRE-family HTH domain
MDDINAYTVNRVNAYTANEVTHHQRVGRQSESEPSEFWSRLTEAWKPKGLAISQNGVATKLGMSQGSTHRWFTGEGYPETEVLRRIADLGGVTTDWLLNGTLPKSPIGKTTALGRLMLAWEQLDDRGKEHVYQSAVGQLALQSPAPGPAKKTGSGGSGKP